MVDSKSFLPPSSRRRYVGVYMVFECYRNAKIPIISASVESSAGNAASATVYMHPSPFIYKLTRGINVYIVCILKEAGINSEPVERVMFIGDIVNIQSTTRRNNTEYIVSLTDNRKYINELPSYYLKLIRTQHDEREGLHYRSDSGNMQSPVGDVAGGYAGPGGIPSLYDEQADANFYGIGGQYHLETFYYDINNDKVKAMLAGMTDGYTITSYINKMLEPLYKATGWEPYYVNMNRKKRITAHLEIYNDGLYQADIEAKYAEAAWQSIKDSHVELTTTYEDALARLAELGYFFNTNLFPSMTGGNENKLELDDSDTPEYQIKSTLFPGELLNIVKIKDGDTKTVVPRKDMRFILGLSEYGAERYARNPEIYDAEHNGDHYYAVVNRETTMGGNLTDISPKIVEFSIIPKMYGVLPPKCNWETMREGVTFNSIMAEPPLTALKYNLRDSFADAAVYACSYPGGLEFYSTFAPPPPEAEWQPGGETTMPSNTPKIGAGGGEAGIGSNDGGKTYKPNIEAAITKHVAAAHRNLVKAIIWVESKGDPTAHGASDDRGLMQLVPRYAAANVDGSRLFEVEYNVWAGYNHYLAALKEAKGNHAYALKLYNAWHQKDLGWDYSQRVLDRLKYISGEDATTITPLSLTNTTATTKEPERAPRAENVKPETANIQTYMDRIHPASEHIYGVKRISTTGSSVYELEKAAKYAEIESKDDTLVISKEQKFKMIKQKVKKDFYESTVSGNTGSVVVQGLAEDVMVGFPYIIYYPPHSLFYYGLVMSVAHRIDNSAGTAYTEISLANLFPTMSIHNIEDKFSGYVRESYVKNSKNSLKDALKRLNGMYSMTTHTDNITEEEYALFDTSKAGSREKIINLLTSRPGHRHICTIERLQNYLYGNSKTVPIWDDVAGEYCKSKQWITRAMQGAIQNIINDYATRLRTETQLSGYIVEVQDEPADEPDEIAPPTAVNTDELNEEQGDEQN